MTTSGVRPETTARPLDDAFEAELERMALAVNEPDAAPPIESMQGGGLSRYAWYQARDFVKYRGSVMFVLAMLILWVFKYNERDMLAGAMDGHAGRATSLDGALSMLMVLGGLVLGVLGSLFTTAGIVSRDREGGYQRFLLAKPVRATRFYVQQFAINGVGLLAVAALTLLVTSVAFAHAVPMLAPLAVVASVYAAAGGLTFLLSTLVRYEVFIALVSVPLSIILREAARDGHWWAGALAWLFPDFVRLQAFIPFGPMHTPGAMLGAAAMSVAYGTAYLALGTYILRRRSIIR